MNELIDKDHGLTPLLGGILVILCVQFITRLVKDWRDGDHRRIDHLVRATEENTKAVYHLTRTVQHLDDRIVAADIGAAKTEFGLSRLLSITKEIAGDRWAEIQEKVIRAEFKTKGEL